MRKSLVELFVFANALTLSATVYAVGMGSINVASGLGQQLKADIELMAVSKAEKASLVARLASPEAYKDAGLEYPYGNKFKFQIESRADGEPYLKVSSDQPINDPFVIMLVELNWSSGKMLREYTFLLDPPGYVPEQPALAAVEAVAPSIQSATEEPVTAPEAQAAPMDQQAQLPVEEPVVQASPTETIAAGETTPAPEPAPAGIAAPAEQLAPLTAEPLPELDEWIEVKRGDTMRELADQYRLVDMSLDRMLVAFYRANKGLFEGNNMNRIKAGKILRLPHQGEVEAVSQNEAAREIRAQAADWNAYRQKLSSAATLRSQPQEARQIVTGKINSSVADMAPPVKESAREVLKLSKGEAPGDRTAAGAGGKTESAQDRKNAEQEEAIARSKALQEEQARVAMLEKQIKELQRLAELKSGQVEVKTEAAALAQSAKAAAPPVVAASAVAPAPAEKPKPIAVAPKPEPESFMDQVMSGVSHILDEPLYLAGGAVILLGLGGLGFVLIRRKKKPYHEEIGEPAKEAAPETAAAVTTGRIAAPVVPSPDTGDFTRMGVTDEAAPSESNIDPIGEADLFLNFGRDAQAEEILKEAMQSTPNDHRIHLKLLGIYVNRVDPGSFAGIAQQLKDSGDEDAWQQALAMGRKLDPNNSLYGGSGVESTVSSNTAFDATQLFAQENAPAAPALDFDIDLGSAAAKVAPAPEQDFLGNAEQNAIMSFDVLAAGQAPEMDLNVAAGLGGSQPEAASPVTGDMIFDVGSNFMPAPEQQQQAKPAEPAPGGGMEFSLDFPIESSAEKAVPEVQPAGIGLAGISLNFDDTVIAGGSMPAGKDEHWQEIATKLDLAKAYQEMGDASGAREILEEVLRDGDAGQREAAQTLINQLG